MSYDEFFKALCPYIYQKPRDTRNFFQNFEKQISKILEIADVDKDGFISFHEFFFFVLLVQTPEKAIKSDFRKCGGKMNPQ